MELPYNSQCYGSIQLPPQVLHQFHDLKSFCSNVFPSEQLAQTYVNSEFFCSCAVLTLYNDTVIELNRHILEGMHGKTYTFDSTDSADVNEAETDVHKLPAEFLQSLNPACLPSSHLCLKLNAPVILLCNLYPKQGLCNGTRLIITCLIQFCLKGRILGGAFHNAV